MDSLLTIASVVGPANRFAIHGHNLAACLLEHGLNPCHKALLELRRVYSGKHPPKRVVGGHAVAHIQKLFQP